jgi:hypothetical protein
MTLYTYPSKEGEVCLPRARFANFKFRNNCAAAEADRTLYPPPTSSSLGPHCGPPDSGGSLNDPPFTQDNPVEVARCVNRISLVRDLQQ